MPKYNPISDRRRKQLEELRDRLQLIQTCITAVLDDRATLTDMARELGTDPQRLAHDINTGFSAYLRTKLMTTQEVAALLEETRKPTDKLVAAILGIKQQYNPNTNVLELPPDYDEEALIETLCTLTPREERILQLHYGIEPYTGRAMTYEAIAAEFGVTTERILQIQNKALRKLRQPNRINRYLYPTGLKVKVYEQYTNQMFKTASNRLRSALSVYEKAEEMNKQADAIEQACANGCVDPETGEAVKLFIDEDGNSVSPLAHMSIEELDLSVRSYNCLIRAGIRTVGDLSTKSVEQLMRVRNLGKRSMDEVITKAYLVAHISIYYENGAPYTSPFNQSPQT